MKDPMTSFIPQCPLREKRIIGPGLNVIERRPENSNQDMDARKHLVDKVYRCQYTGQQHATASQLAAMISRYPKDTRQSVTP